MLPAIWTIVWRITQYASYAALIGYFLWSRTHAKGVPSVQPPTARPLPKLMRKLGLPSLAFAIGVALSSLAYGVIAPPLTRFGLRTIYVMPSYGVDLDKGIIAETAWEADLWLAEDPGSGYAGYAPGELNPLVLYAAEDAMVIPVREEPSHCAGYQPEGHPGGLASKMEVRDTIGFWFCFITSEGASGRLFVEGILPGPVRLLKIDYAILTLPSP
jgi:hypothetical protein